jgi:hypothetical protein
MNNITIEDVDNAWNTFQSRANRAEQYQFPLIGAFHLKLMPLYNDLHENWDEHHAKLFIDYFDKVVYPKLGWAPVETRGE